MKKKIACFAVCAFVVVLTMASCKSESKSGFYPYDLTKYVSLGNYSSLKVELDNEKVTDEDVEKEIKSQMTEKGITSQRTKTAPVSDGDTVNIDYEGLLDGKAFEGGTASGASLEIGSGSFIDGFEAGLVGKKTGDKVSLNLKFPENYKNKSVAGKNVVFNVKINSVSETIYPNLDSETVAKFSDYKSVSEYRESVYSSLVPKKKESVESSNKNKIVDAVVSCCNLKKYPKSEVNKYKEILISKYTAIAENNNMTLENYVRYFDFSLEDFEDEMLLNAKKNVEKEMVFLLVAEKEKITLDSDEFEAGVSEYMNKNGYTSRETLMTDIGEENLKGILLVEKAVGYMAEKIGRVKNA